MKNYRLCFLLYFACILLISTGCQPQGIPDPDAEKIQELEQKLTEQAQQMTQVAPKSSESQNDANTSDETESNNEVDEMFYPSISEYPLDDRYEIWRDDCPPNAIEVGVPIFMRYNWYTETEDQVQSFKESVINQIAINGSTIPSETYLGKTLCEEGYYYTTVYVLIGTLEPGEYEIETINSFNNKIFDGEKWYGPGTDDNRYSESCELLVGQAIDNEGEISTEDTPVPCNRAKFISESIADDTEFNPGETFTQTWTIRNDGTCIWDKGYRVIFNEGDQMSGESSYYLDREVKPGDTIKLSVHLTAPNNPGEYKGYWNIQAPDRELFTFFWAQIIVKGRDQIDFIFIKNNDPNIIIENIEILAGSLLPHDLYLDNVNIQPGEMRKITKFDNTRPGTIFETIPAGVYKISFEQPERIVGPYLEVNIQKDGQIIEFPGF